VRTDRYGFSVTLSTLSHVIVLLLFIVSFEFDSQMPVLENVNNNSKIISAVAVQAPLVDQQPTPPPPPPPKVAEIEPPKPLPLPLPAPAKPLVLKIAQPAAIAIKPARVKKPAVPKDLFEKQLLADFKPKAIPNKKARQKALEQAMEKELKENAAKSLQQDLSREQQRAAGARAQGIVDKYKALILDAISRRWRLPSGVNKKIYTTLLIRLTTQGEVIDVQITKSSGDLALDRSAREAVFNASPLQVPSDKDAFAPFKEFSLKMKPENAIVTGGIDG
jgi:TonB family protein